MKLYDYYKLFNLPLGSSENLVKKAYDEMMFEWSDKPTKKSSMDQLEKVLNEAMFVLSNPPRKEAYDRVLLKYYIQKSKRENYKKYGTSTTNPWTELAPKQQSDGKYKRKNKKALGMPKLKAAVLISLACLALLATLFSFLFLKAYSPAIMISFVFLFGAYVITGIFGIRNVFYYVQVREKVKPKLSAARSVVYASSLIYVAVPFMLVQGLRALPNILLSNTSPTAVLSHIEIEEMWVTANFSTGEGKQRVSIAYPEKYTKSKMREKWAQGKLGIQYHPKFSAIARWTILD